MASAEKQVQAALGNLRRRVKEKDSIAAVARAVDMPRAWLSRVLSPKTQAKLREVEEHLSSDEFE